MAPVEASSCPAHKHTAGWEMEWEMDPVPISAVCYSSPTEEGAAELQCWSRVLLAAGDVGKGSGGQGGVQGRGRCHMLCMSHPSACQTRQLSWCYLGRSVE